MIIFDLLCSCGCQFEGWFRDRDDFFEQQHSGILQCPRCGGAEVRKILSPVAMQKKTNARNDEHEKPRPEAPTVEANRALEVLQAVQRFVGAHFDDVGTRLAEESLKMHYGIAEPRNIRGVASEEEENMLREEGIELLKIPMPAPEEESN